MDDVDRVHETMDVDHAERIPIQDFTSVAKRRPAPLEIHLILV